MPHYKPDSKYISSIRSSLTKKNDEIDNNIFNKKRTLSSFKTDSYKNMDNNPEKKSNKKTYRNYVLNSIRIDNNQPIKIDNIPKNMNINNVNKPGLKKKFVYYHPKQADIKIDDVVSNLDNKNENDDKFSKLEKKIDDGFSAIGKKIDEGFSAIGKKIDEGFVGFKTFLSALFEKYFQTKKEEKSDEPNNSFERERFPSVADLKKSDIEQFSHSSSNRSEPQKPKTDIPSYWRRPKAQRSDNNGNKPEKADNNSSDENNLLKFSDDNSGKYYNKNDSIPIHSMRRKYQNKIKKKTQK